MTAALTPEQRIEALEAELAALRDSECDKIMAMSETQINALTRMQGSNPKDIAQLGRMAARAAIKDVEINRLRAELAACKRDAERYRRLRLTASRCKDPAPTGCIRVLAEYVPDENWNPYQDVQTDLDCAIDAAMAAGEKA